jgi:hypothetical protein
MMRFLGRITVTLFVAVVSASNTVEIVAAYPVTVVAGLHM